MTSNVSVNSIFIREKRLISMINYSYILIFNHIKIKMKYYLLAIISIVVVFTGFYLSTYMLSVQDGVSTNIGQLDEEENSGPGGYVLSGTLIVKLKDVPKDWGEAQHVFILLGSVEIHRSGAGNQSGWVRVVKNGGWIDLRDVLTDAKYIGECSLQSGDYNLIRFMILDGKVTVGGVNYTSPSGSGKITISISRGGIRIEPWRTSIIVIDVMPKVVGSRSSGFKIVQSAKAYVET